LLNFERRGPFYPVHEEETEGNVSGRRLPVNKDSGAVSDGRMADILVKEAAERAQALEADLEADIRNRQTARREQLFGSFNTPLRQILMGRLLESLSEQSDKMVARETCFARNLIHIKRQIIAVVHKFAGAAQSAINIRRKIPATNFNTGIFRHGFYLIARSNRSCLYKSTAPYVIPSSSVQSVNGRVKAI